MEPRLARMDTTSKRRYAVIEAVAGLVWPRSLGEDVLTAAGAPDSAPGGGATPSVGATGTSGGRG